MQTSNLPGQLIYFSYFGNFHVKVKPDNSSKEVQTTMSDLDGGLVDML